MLTGTYGTSVDRTVLNSIQFAWNTASVSARKKLLDKRKEELAKQDSPLPVRRSIEDYCESIRRRLGNLSFDTKRNVLRLLLRSIVYDGDVVRITGIVPLTPAHEDVSQASENTPLPAREIEGTGIDHLVRNHAGSVVFTLTGAVSRPRDLAIAASRANLVKANAARRRTKPK
jgi:hypothetical protein